MKPYRFTRFQARHALSASLGDPDGAPDLDSLIAMVAGLRRQRDEARQRCVDLEAVYASTAADLQVAFERIDIDQEVMTRLEGERDEMAAAGRAVVEATDEMRKQWAETEARIEVEKVALGAALEAARLTLLAEQGKPEGAASERWHVSYDLHDFCWWRGEDDEPPEVECHLSGGDWRWTKPGVESNPYPTALDCMNAADKDSP